MPSDKDCMFSKATVLYDNQPMLDLLRTSGHPVQVRCDGGDVLSVELDVGKPAAIAGTR